MSWSLLAAALLLAAATLLGWAWQVLGWRRWLDFDDGGSEAAPAPLVLAGPFRLVRHPQSLALLCVLAAAALTWRRPAMLILGSLGAAVVLALAVRDEARLAGRFGEAYARYRRAVPFLLPRPR